MLSGLREAVFGGPPPPANNKAGQHNRAGQQHNTTGQGGNTQQDKTEQNNRATEQNNITITIIAAARQERTCKMAEYAVLCDFQNLYAAHRAARRGKQWKPEVIEFELNLAENLCGLKRRLEAREYMPLPYYHFVVHEPKKRDIHALHYPDRVVQRCLCDNIVAPTLEQRLIFDNAACRKGKGTHFAIYRMSRFLREHHRAHGTEGYFLKCDFSRYFENIDHAVLKARLETARFDSPSPIREANRRQDVWQERNGFAACHSTADRDIQTLLWRIIDSYESRPGKGLPLGNQTSQWFALYYLDPLDRLIKERLRIKGYSRYMDDLVLVHESKEYLRSCLESMRELAEGRLLLRFNEKTQIFPIASGVNYLGFHFYLTKQGKVVRKVRAAAKNRFRRALREMRTGFAAGAVDAGSIDQRLASYLGHMRHGHTYHLRSRLLRDFVLRRGG
jgi:hypothetical protein